MSNQNVRLSMMAAMASNRVIGGDGQLLWNIPEDMKLFRTQTTGKPIIMGRKTFESFNKALPNRDNIVITNQKDWSAEGAIVTHSLGEALEVAQEKAAQRQCDEIVVIGGGTIYQQFLNQSDRIYLTEIANPYKGDALFPEIDQNEWTIDREDALVSQEKYGFDVIFKEYNRKKKT